MAKFSIDVNRRFVDRDGKRRKDRVVCVAFHNAAQGAAALSAGDLVVVKGELQEDNKKDPNTQEWRKSYSVVCESVSAFRPNDGGANDGAAESDFSDLPAEELPY